MSIANRDFMLAVMRENGRADALNLRSRALSMDNAAILAERHKIPMWSARRDYSGWAVGAPVQYDGRVYTLLVPHKASPDNPAKSPDVWKLVG